MEDEGLIPVLISFQSLQQEEAKPFVRKYDLDYSEAEKLYHEKKFDETLEAAKYNLTDPTLPRWHQIKNHLLWAHASDSWEVAEEQRLVAEGIYSAAARLTRDDEEDAHKALRKLRADLDYIAQGQKDDHERNLESAAEELQRPFEDSDGEEAELLEMPEEEKASPDLVLPFRGKSSSSGKDGGLMMFSAKWAQHQGTITREGEPLATAEASPSLKDILEAEQLASMRAKRKANKTQHQVKITRERGPQAIAEASPSLKDILEAKKFDSVRTERPANKTTTSSYSNRCKSLAELLRDETARSY